MFAKPKLEEEIAAALAAERDILLAGNLSELNRLEPQKLALREKLQGGGIAIGKAELAKLRSLAEHNDRLLAAAMDGLKAARIRLSPSNGSHFETYKKDGQRKKVIEASRELSKKF